MTTAATDTNGKYVTQVLIQNGSIIITYGNAANAALNGQTLQLTPYETPDRSVAWRCGAAAVPGTGTNLLGTASGGTTAAYAAGTLGGLTLQKYLPASCRA